jgi:hypothetical protein
MIKRKTISYARKSAITFVLIAAGFVALASLGDGGGNRKKKAKTSGLFTPPPSFGSFSLKTKQVNFRGGKLFSTPPKNEMVSYQALQTYRRGNTIVIQPQKQKVTLPRYVKTPEVKGNIFTLGFDMKHK